VQRSGFSSVVDHQGNAVGATDEFVPLCKSFMGNSDGTLFL
jgi:hypothetical protein